MDSNHERSVPFAPMPYIIYDNRGGGRFLCVRNCYNETTAIMQNIKSGWTFTAHGIRRYPDGTIVWDYSTGGRFEKCS